MPWEETLFVHGKRIRDLKQNKSHFTVESECITWKHYEFASLEGVLGCINLQERIKLVIRGLNK